MVLLLTRETVCHRIWLDLETHGKRNRSTRGKILHTRRRHFINHCGCQWRFPIMFSGMFQWMSACSAPCSKGLSLFQRTFTGIFNDVFQWMLTFVSSCVQHFASKHAEASAQTDERKLSPWRVSPPERVIWNVQAKGVPRGDWFRGA